MQISFFEEFPTSENLAKVEMVHFETKVYVAAESLEDFYAGAEPEHKPFVEGLIQLAAACRMFRDFGEVEGPVRMARQEKNSVGGMSVRLSKNIHGAT